LKSRKKSRCYCFNKKIQEAGIRIDGVGIQGHWRYNKIPFKNIEESLEAFSKLGIKVMFTELDLGVLPNPWDGNTADISKTGAGTTIMNPYADGLPDSVQTLQAKAYKDLFTLFLKHKDVISRVTFWGVNDSQSWLNNWPVRGRTNYPLLFDRGLQPKPSFYSIINLRK